MRKKVQYRWESWSDEDLLDTRLCDLGLKLKGSPVERYCSKLQREVHGLGLRLRPHFWISTEFFVPDGYVGIAIPFYLLHPRLLKLEKKMTGEAEGEGPRQIMKLLRHEFGHVFDNAYRCRRRKARQELFGSSSRPYKNYYESVPYSRKFVRHIEGEYAQSHPDEDFAETLAVLLTPRSRWRKKYESWPAMYKLQYVNGLIEDFRSRKPLIKNRKEYEPLNQCTMTLRKYYEKKLKYLRGVDGATLDRKLKRVFMPAEKVGSRNAGRFIRQIKKKAARRVSAKTGIFQYKVHHVINDVLTRCRERRFALIRVKKRQLEKDFLGLLELESRRYEKRGLYRKIR